MRKLGIVLVAVLGLCGSAGFEYAKNNSLDFSGTVCETTDCAAAENHEYGVCRVYGCNQRESHEHQVCQVTGCNETENHEHNGVLYYGHSADDGHAYHNCGTAGCMQTGEHSHAAINKEHGKQHHD